MHGELVLLVGVIASAAGTAALLVRRPTILRDRLVQLFRRRRE